MASPPAAPETRSVRLLKVGEQVRHVISELLIRQEDIALGDFLANRFGSAYAEHPAERAAA